MIPQSSLVLLDTNVLVHLARGKDAGQKLNADYQLQARPETPLISVVTVGECLAFAKKCHWGQKKEDVLKKLLRRLVVVDISRPTVLERYAELDAFAQANGFGLGKNDLWIAATASATSSHLLTTDKDFLPLNSEYVNVEYVDPETLRSHRGSS